MAKDGELHTLQSRVKPSRSGLGFYPENKDRSLRGLKRIGMAISIALSAKKGVERANLLIPEPKHNGE